MKPGKKARGNWGKVKRPRGRSVQQAAAQRHARERKALDERQAKMSGEVRVRRVDPATLRDREGGIR